MIQLNKKKNLNKTQEFLESLQSYDDSILQHLLPSNNNKLNSLVDAGLKDGIFTQVENEKYKNFIKRYQQNTRG